MREAGMIEHTNGHAGLGWSLAGPAAPAEPTGRATAGQLREKLQCLRLELADTAAGERRARQDGWCDGLTTLPSRAHFRLRLGEALARRLPTGRAVGLLCVGLDASRPAAADFGAAAADELLRIVSARLRHALRANDMIGRVGRVEFGCMLPDLPDRRRGGAVARRLLDALGAPLRIGAIELCASARIGLALFPDDGRTADALLDNAEAALFRGRREASELVFFGQATRR